jgi:hypothetical protein
MTTANLLNITSNSAVGDFHVYLVGNIAIKSVLDDSIGDSIIKTPKVDNTIDFFQKRLADDSLAFEPVTSESKSYLSRLSKSYWKEFNREPLRLCAYSPSL